MKKFLLAALFLVASIVVIPSSFVSEAEARTIHRETYGAWELYAWDGRNRFCALKTYWGEKTLAIRMDSNGVTVVVTDPAVSFVVGNAEASFWFDGSWWGDVIERTYDDMRTQVFIEIKRYEIDSFLYKVANSSEMELRSIDLEYRASLEGTRLLTPKLRSCVNYFGF